MKALIISSKDTPTMQLVKGYLKALEADVTEADIYSSGYDIVFTDVKAKVPKKASNVCVVHSRKPRSMKDRFFHLIDVLFEQTEEDLEADYATSERICQVSTAETYKKPSIFIPFASKIKRPVLPRPIAEKRVLDDLEAVYGLPLKEVAANEDPFTCFDVNCHRFAYSGYDGWMDPVLLFAAWHKTIALCPSCRRLPEPFCLDANVFSLEAKDQEALAEEQSAYTLDRMLKPDESFFNFRRMYDELTGSDIEDAAEYSRIFGD